MLSATSAALTSLRCHISLDFPSAPGSARRRDGRGPQKIIRLLLLSCGLPCATRAQMPVLRVCCPSAGFAAIPSMALHTSILISYKCIIKELKEIPSLALHLLKGHQGNVNSSCEQRYQKIMKSELDHCCVHFLFSLHLEMSSLSPAQATTDSHMC